MNINGLMVFLLVLISGPLVITIFFYGGKWALRLLETPDSPQALASIEAKTDSVSAIPQTALADSPAVALPTV